MHQESSAADLKPNKYKKALKPKQKALCKAYLELGEKKKAGIKVGYKPKNAKVTACRELAKPNVKAYLTKLQDQLYEKTMTDLVDGFRYKKQLLADIMAKAHENLMQADFFHKEAAQEIVRAIAEDNKMEGHYAPEKVIQTNLNLDADVQECKEIALQIASKYDRGY